MKRLLLSIMLVAVLLGPPGFVQNGSAVLTASAQPVIEEDPPARPRFTITDLGTLGGATSQAFGINKKGQVVGLSHFTDGNPRAFLWENGAMLHLGTLGGRSSAAFGINSAGQVVGFAEIVDNTDPQDPYYYPHALLWQDGAMQDLGTLGGLISNAYDINDAGQVVVTSYLANWVEHAFLWENNQIKDLNNQIPADSGWVLRCQLRLAVDARADR